MVGWALLTLLLAKTLQDFRTDIENNQVLIPNYGERWRNGETISTAFVESAINPVVAKRFVKKQQMQWTKIWHPNFRSSVRAKLKRAA